MNKTNQTLLIIAILAGLAFLFVTFTSKTEAPKVEVEQKTAVQELYEDEMEIGFVESCFESAPLSQCQCTYDSLMNELGFEGFVDMSTEYSETGILTDKAISIFSSCI